MKFEKLVVFLLVLINSFCIKVTIAQSSVGQPEFCFKIVDNNGAYFRIKAEKYGDTPIYDKNFNYTSNFDFAWDVVDGSGSPQSFYAQNVLIHALPE